MGLDWADGREWAKFVSGLNNRYNLGFAMTSATMSRETSNDSPEAIIADESLDAVGLTCPLPLLKAKQALNKMRPGQVLSVVCTDPGSVRDFQVFANQSGHQLLGSTAVEGRYGFWLKKSDARG